jgi:hypothetical protein
MHVVHEELRELKTMLSAGAGARLPLRPTDLRQDVTT